MAAEHRVPWEFNLAQNLIFQTFYCLNKEKENDHNFTSKVSMAQLVRNLIESPVTKCNGASNLNRVFSFFFKFSQTIRANSGFQGKNRELNILFILNWTHQIGVLQRFQPCSIMLSHGGKITVFRDFHNSKKYPSISCSKVRGIKNETH